jgi:hypothetical protein
MTKYDWLSADNKYDVIDDGDYTGIIKKVKVGTNSKGDDSISLKVEIPSIKKTAFISYNVSFYGGQMAFREAFPFVTEADGENDFKCLEYLEIEFTAKRTSDGKYTRYKIEKVYRNNASEDEPSANVDNYEPEPAATNNGDINDDLPF